MPNAHNVPPHTDELSDCKTRCGSSIKPELRTGDGSRLEVLEGEPMSAVLTSLMRRVAVERETGSSRRECDEILDLVGVLK